MSKLTSPTLATMSHWTQEAKTATVVNNPHNFPEVKPPEIPILFNLAVPQMNVDAEISDLMKSLGESRFEFEQFEKENPYVVEKRRLWIMEKTRDSQNVLNSGLEGHRKFVTDYVAREPGLAEVSEISHARKRVAELERELEQAKSDLVAIESNGSPLSAYTKKIARAEAMVTSLASTLQKQSRSKLLMTHYGHSDEWRMGKEALNYINSQPSVHKFATFSFQGRVSGISGSEALTVPQLQLAHSNVLSALTKLREMAAT
jgi:hypothetical protein